MTWTVDEVTSRPVSAAVASGAQWVRPSSGPTTTSGARQITEASSTGEGWTAAGEATSGTGPPPWYTATDVITTTAAAAESSDSMSEVAGTIAVEPVMELITAAATLNDEDVSLNWTTTTRFLDANSTSVTNWSVEAFSTGVAASPPLLRHSHLVYTLLTCVVLAAIILAAIVGNAFVVAAIALERNLQSVANYLIASLAVTDLLVAVLVMPLAAVNEISSRWFFGAAACDVFVSFDVLCCTASILHLVAISLDRYWAVTRVDYIHNRPVRRIFAMIALSWAFSTVISLPPLFGWKAPDDDPDVTGVCLISQVRGACD